MKRFHYRAVDATGQLHAGCESATNRLALESQLESKALVVLSLRADSQWLVDYWQHLRLRRRARQVLAPLLWQASQLLAAGVPLLSTLDALCEVEAKGPLFAVLKQIRQQVGEGTSLSAACGHHPGVFNNSVVASLEVAEVDGSLADVLEKLEQDIRWQQLQWRQMSSTLSYPLFAAVLVLAVVAFLLLVVVPELAGVLQQQHVSRETAWLLAASGGARAHGAWAVMALLLAGLAGGGLALWVPRCRLWLHQAVLWLPGMGQTLVDLMLARYCRTVGRLYQGGTELLDALRYGEGQIGNRAIKSHLMRARLALLDGMTLSDALAEFPMLPVSVRYQLVAGEQAGALGLALERIAEQLARSAEFRLTRMRQFVSPLVMCMVGGLLVWVIAAVLLPIYDTMLTMEGSL